MDGFRTVTPRKRGLLPKKTGLEDVPVLWDVTLFFWGGGGIGCSNLSLAVFGSFYELFLVLSDSVL